MRVSRLWIGYRRRLASMHRADYAIVGRQDPQKSYFDGQELLDD